MKTFGRIVAASPWLLSLTVHGLVLWGIQSRAVHLVSIAPPPPDQVRSLRFSGSAFDRSTLNEVEIESSRGVVSSSVRAKENTLANQHSRLIRKTSVSPDLAGQTPPRLFERGQLVIKKSQKTELQRQKTVPSPDPRKTVETSPKEGTTNTIQPSPEVTSPRPQGAFGQDGAPPGAIDLYRAFLKTLPLAAKSDESWTRVPVGDAGTILITLRLDQEFKLLPIEINEEQAAPIPSYLKRMVLLNRNFLLRSRFALAPQSVAGAQRLKIAAVVSLVSPDREAPDATGVRAFGLRGNTKATGVYFTYFSGRHIELTVEILP